MPAFKKELIIGASLDLTLDAVRYVRAWKVNGIDLTDLPDPIALLKVIDALELEGITIGMELSPAYSQLILSRIRLLPVVERRGKDVWVDLEFFTQPENLTPTTYIVRNSTRATVQQSYRIPGTNEMIRARFDAISGGVVQGGGSLDFVQPDVILGSFYRPAKSLGITALQVGHPTGETDEHVGDVNDDDWPVSTATFPDPFGATGTAYMPAIPKPKGYWMIGEYETTYERARGMTLVTAQAMTRIHEDWSEVFTLRNHLTGKRPFGGFTELQQATVLDGMLSEDYSHGIIWPTAGPDEGLGIVRVGGQPMTNFQTLFGF